jgi:hypothetical protein
MCSDSASATALGFYWDGCGHVCDTFATLRRRFCSDQKVDGFPKDGPVAVSLFEQGDELDTREARALRQRGASDLIERLLALIGKG